MERKKDERNGARLATALAALLLACASAWDGLRSVRGTGAPDISYVLLAVAIATACLGVLLRVLAARPRWASRTGTAQDAPLPAAAAARPGRLRNVVELATAGLLLLGFWVRADPGIPADPPVVVLELLGALVLGGSAAFARAPASVSDPIVR